MYNISFNIFNSISTQRPHFISPIDGWAPESFNYRRISRWHPLCRSQQVVWSSKLPCLCFCRSVCLLYLSHLVRRSVRLSVGRSVYLYVRRSVCLSVGRSVRPSVRPFFVGPSVHPFVGPFVRLFVRPYVGRSVRPSVHLSICLSVSLYICIYACVYVKNTYNISLHVFEGISS